jgi:hypothetical protein
MCLLKMRRALALSTHTHYFTHQSQRQLAPTLEHYVCVCGGVCSAPAQCMQTGLDPGEPFGPGATLDATILPDEFFYYSASADTGTVPVTVIGPGNVSQPDSYQLLYETAVEGAYAKGPRIPGDEMVFERTRFLIHCPAIDPPPGAPDNLCNHPHPPATARCSSRALKQRVSNPLFQFTYKCCGRLAASCSLTIRHRLRLQERSTCFTSRPPGPANPLGIDTDRTRALWVVNAVFLSPKT